MPEIEVQSPNGPRRRVPMTDGRMIIGRGEDSHVFLPDYRLSRRHAEVEQRIDGFYIVDLGSTNGTFLNGQRIVGERRLSDGDLISLGDSRLVFSSGASDDTVEGGALDGAQAYRIKDLHARITDRSVASSEVGGRQSRVFQLLSKASAALLGQKTLPEIFEQMLDVIFEAIPVQRSAIVILEEGAEPVVRASRSRTGQPIAKVSRAIAKRVVQQRLALLVPNVAEDIALRGRKSIMGTGIRSAICAPLWLPPRQGAHEEVIGLIYADTQDFERAFSEDDLQILTAFANIAASKIENTKLFAENAEKQRLEGEMRTAAEIQRSILPRDAPRVPGVELFGESRSCESVGGDYHDFYWTGAELSFAVADVSGKGLGAAMLMAALRAAVHAHWQEPALHQAATRINATFFENVPSDRYATCFLGRFDPFSGRLSYVNAGHPPPILVHANGRTDSLHEGGPGIGLFDAGAFSLGERQLSRGDTLLAYSDGVSESWPDAPQAEAALVDLARSYAGVPVAALCQEILAAVERRRGGVRTDDCTLVVMRWTPSP
jgi:sigma-B regulation protein RsbU (phosphoserine phosphatase)